MFVLLFKAQMSLLHDAALTSLDTRSLPFLSASAALGSVPLLYRVLCCAVIH